MILFKKGLAMFYISGTIMYAVRFSNLRQGLAGKWPLSRLCLQSPGGLRLGWIRHKKWCRLFRQNNGLWLTLGSFRTTVRVRALPSVTSSSRVPFTCEKHHWMSLEPAIVPSRREKTGQLNPCHWWPCLRGLEALGCHDHFLDALTTHSSWSRGMIRGGIIRDFQDNPRF